MCLGGYLSVRSGHMSPVPLEFSRALDPLELELQVALSSLALVPGTELWSSAGSQPPNLLPSPKYIFFKMLYLAVTDPLL